MKRWACLLTVVFLLLGIAACTTAEDKNPESKTSADTTVDRDFQLLYEGASG